MAQRTPPSGADDPQHPLPDTPAVRRLVGVGVGPGNPDLVTLAAVRELRDADVILVPATEASGSGPGRAETIVRAVCPDAAAALRRVPFSMADRRGVTDRRREAWQVSAAAAVEAYAAGAATVVFATVGDPSVYSTFSYLAAHVTTTLPDVNVHVIPGITAMQALAAASRTPLVEGTEVLTLVPYTAGHDTLRAALDVADTVVVYKAGRHLPDVTAQLREHGRADHAVVGTDISLPDQRIVAVPQLDEETTLPYFSTILSPPERTHVGGRL
ncbi:Precorrin-2 C(20)-methyltransferase [Austwickia sp. TVS 96-490-7B]|uniref:precorrin-2 C(20)-methyltransferase n=1 Tax=Austwickia sp. TVS 96-490-7B TaxID=2830843 RepID=UPI001D338966|nr:precorrin-2 C(20)-methyltransferase [Austwickia sp. TVS 96-490-7B]MBW3084982.1 Precorrin-2 C(20)-methyltransferase [Austwickia sp. TVS 96-490-7B]